MNGHASIQLVQRLRRDRRKLLAFLLSRDSLYKRKLPPGAVSLDDINLDEVSVDYILECLSKGCAVDLSEAMWRFYNDFSMPPMSDFNFGEIYFLATTPETSGPPPTRAPPIATASLLVGSLNPSIDQISKETILNEELEGSEEEEEDEEKEEKVTRCQSNDTCDLALLLPPFETGLSEYDVCETAYEVLLASVGEAGALELSPQKREDGKKSKLGRRFRRRKPSKRHPESSNAIGLAHLLHTMRTQLEVSEALDRRTRKAMVQLSLGLAGKRMETLLVPLELLCVMSSTDFSDRRAYKHWQKRQLNLIEEGLLHHHLFAPDPSNPMCKQLKIMIAKVEETEEYLPSPLGEAERSKTLKELRSAAIALAERSYSRDQSVGAFHWADGYPLNVRLYEKLLSSIFDILDEGQLIEEVDGILDFQSTWRILGITQYLHETCCTWVFFRQFVLTGELAFLQTANYHMKKISLHEHRSPLENSYVKSVPSTMEGCITLEEVSYVQSVLILVRSWIDKQLKDYHSHFSENLVQMEELVSFAIDAGQLFADECHQRECQQREAERTSLTLEVATSPKQVEDYILSSVKRGYDRVLERIDARSGPEAEDFLLALAENVELLAKEDASKFAPILFHWQPYVMAISASLLHRLFYIKLEPFLGRVPNLGKEVSSILSVADRLEQYLLELMASVDNVESNNFAYKHQIVPYKIEVVSAPLIMQWVNVQVLRLSDWVDRTVHQEKWEAVSKQQPHGESIVEIFRIIEEIIEQFFNLKLPIQIPMLKTLTKGFNEALKLYSDEVASQVGDVANLVPPLPVLTRYNEDVFMKGYLKRTDLETQALDEGHIAEINLLTTSKLCIRLNTLNYILDHLDILEENIQERWAATIEQRYEFDSSTSTITKASQSTGESKLKPNEGAKPTEELSSLFKSTRKEINMAIGKIGNFTGMKIIYWDMRGSYINGLYKGGVSKSRIDKVVSDLDIVLGQICDIIEKSLRDQLVYHLLKASMEGFVCVLLDGGPLRAFSITDAANLQEDLHLLEDFFIADGDGLPKDIVKEATTHAKQVIRLHSIETSTLIESIRHIGQQVAGIDAKINDTEVSSPFDAEVLLRVLCHRIDRDASKFIKKYYRIPKAVE